MQRFAFIGLSLVLGFGSLVAVAAPAEAACRYASDYDTAGRRCGKRSAEMRGPTTGYDGDGGWYDGGSTRRGSVSANRAVAVQKYQVYSPDGYMNLRTTANGAVVRRLANGTSVRLLGTVTLLGKAWNKVQTDAGQTGFVLSSGIMLPQTVATLSQRDVDAVVDAAKRKQRDAAIQAEIAAYQAKSKADAAAWACQTTGYCY